MALTKVLHMREGKETKFGGRREIDHILRKILQPWMNQQYLSLYFIVVLFDRK